MLQYTGYLNTMIGILTPLLIATTPGQWIQDQRTWEAEQNRSTVEESINSSLQELEWEEDGEDGSAKQEELLQLPSDRDSQSIRRGYDRCSHRPWLRFIQERTGKDCWSRHPREEDKRPGGKSPWD